MTIQAAVLKHVKLTINPLSSTTLQPFSREVVHQVFMHTFRPCTSSTLCSDRKELSWRLSLTIRLDIRSSTSRKRSLTSPIQFDPFRDSMSYNQIIMLIFPFACSPCLSYPFCMFCISPIKLCCYSFPFVFLVILLIYYLAYNRRCSVTSS